MVKVLVVFYSKYGHTLRMAEAVGEGVKSIEGVELILRRVDEFEDSKQEVLSNEHSRLVWEKQQSIPVCTLDDLRQASAVLFGSPTRFGNMTAQMKRLIDSTAGLWVKGEMEGKLAAVFTSTSTTHGGQETTCLSMMIPLLHLGMLIVGVPYSTPGMIHTAGRGGTPYGATVVAGPHNDLECAVEDLALCSALGRRVAEAAKKLFG